MRWRPDEPDQIERSETNHAHETLEPYLQRHIEPASHSWRYEHLPQRRQGGPVRITVDGESYDCDASSITWTGFGDNETVPMSSRWSITPTWRMPEVRPTPLGERMADVIREMCEALDSGIAASIRSLVERTDHPESPPHNPHLRMPADDPRRAILHRVQNRNTGPAKTPFTKRGRR